MQLTLITLLVLFISAVYEPTGDEDCDDSLSESEWA